MGVANTIQQTVIELIAQKMSATSAIQGKFSAEGLSAMAAGVDTRMKLAQSLASKDTTTGSELQGMFDVINQTVDDDSDSKYTPMKLFYELVGDAVDDVGAPIGTEALDLLSIAANINPLPAPITKVSMEEQSVITPVGIVKPEESATQATDLFSFLFGTMPATTQMATTFTTKRSHKSVVSEGQMDLLSFFAK